LKKHFCVRHFRFQAVTESSGLDGCDGILGLSPRDLGKRSLLADLKREGLIDRTLISFSNSFHNSTFKSKYHIDQESYIVFGGYNETQVVGGARGLYSMPLSGKALNPDGFWGIDGQGFLYGDTIIQDPRKDPAVLSIIDSGTTLILVPYKVYDGLMMSVAREVKNDPTLSFICTRTEGTQELGVCYFNNTRCEDLTGKLKPLSFIFSNVVYELRPELFLRDMQNSGIPDAPPEKPLPG
jgi:hypothetical protein